MSSIFGKYDKGWYLLRTYCWNNLSGDTREERRILRCAKSILWNAGWWGSEHSQGEDLCHALHLNTRSLTVRENKSWLSALLCVGNIINPLGDMNSVFCVKAESIPKLVKPETRSGWSVKRALCRHEGVGLPERRGLWISRWACCVPGWRFWCSLCWYTNGIDLVRNQFRASSWWVIRAWIIFCRGWSIVRKRLWKWRLWLWWRYSGRSLSWLVRAGCLCCWCGHHWWRVSEWLKARMRAMHSSRGGPIRDFSLWRPADWLFPCHLI